ncbi:hypothetical protein [Methanoculleus chikugoensis]|uniref:hypothetical protein n=1 Tax=Methanoculleus chikugoensis TaxID=118126 RepID=UPI001FB1B668|nr:hypothetical protein [Methanoculleus chikugoensis]
MLDRQMQVFWANAFAMDLLSTSEEEILGFDARRVLDAHLTPLLQERDAAHRLLATMNNGTGIPGLDLSVQDPRGGKSDRSSIPAGRSSGERLQGCGCSACGTSPSKDRQTKGCSPRTDNSRS